MTMDDFVVSLTQTAPPAKLSPSLRALWYAARDDWDGAHRIVQSEDGADAAWVHAYLHRVEGDLANAGYWYRSARRETCSDSLENEWRSIVDALLDAP